LTIASKNATFSAMKTNKADSGNRKRAKRSSKKQGEKIAFDPDHIDTLAKLLRATGTMRGRREYALMRIAVDTMLRSCDILQLTFEQVRHNGDVVHELQVQQQKTGEMVVCALTAPAREALGTYIAGFAANLLEDEPNRLLFPFTTRRYRQLVKRWCGLLQLPPARYSTHSLRRTKAKQLYATTGNLEACRELLGHTNIGHTQKYLGVTRAEALDLARKTVM
jgi:integrase